MKRISFLFIMLLPALAFGQADSTTYCPLFGRETTSWIVGESNWDMPISVYEYYENGDTIIDGLLYHMIEKRDISLHPYGSIRPVSLRLLREDSVHSKLWQRMEDGEECLVMDLDLNVGDTFLFRNLYPVWNMGNQAYVVDSVIDGDRKMVRLSNIGASDWTHEEMEFIEGIGSSHMFHAWIDENPMFGAMLMCVFHDEEHLYENPALAQYEGYVPGECNLRPVGIDETTPIRLNVFPNPSQNHIVVEIEPGAQATVHDIYGHTICSITEPSSDIDISRWPSGSYFVRVRSSTGCTECRCFIKK